MNQLNNVLIEGFVLGEPKELARAKANEKWGRFVKFDLISKRVYRNRQEDLVEEKLIIPVQCWGAVAETVMRYLSRSYTVRVVGRLKVNCWTGKDGRDHRDMEIVASHVEFRPSKYRKDGNGQDRPDEVIVIDNGGEIGRTGEPEFVYTYD